MKRVNILWTSGWDSTFRLLQLAEKGNVEIQPYYVLDDGRPSTDIEIQRMKEIKEMILNKWPHSKNLIKPIKFIKIGEIKKHPDVTSSYKVLREESFMGSQYEWLGWLSKNVGNLELCIHEDDKAHYFIRDYVSKVNDVEGEYYKVDSKKCNKDVVNVFGNYNFPILTYTKLDMMKEAENKNFKDIMMNTWFCFTPINNEACGLCNPCKYAIEEGMSFRLSKSALRRYKYSFLYKVLRKMKKFSSR